MESEDKAHHHADPKPAELAAANAVKPRVARIKAEILEVAKMAGDFGIIPDQVEGLINTVRRRFVDLHKEGKMRPTERTRKNSRGNAETVWVLGRDEKLRVTRGKPVEGDVVGFGPVDVGAFGPDQEMHIIVSVKRKDWERTPSPARVRFI